MLVDAFAYGLFFKCMSANVASKFRLSFIAQHKYNAEFNHMSENSEKKVVIGRANAEIVEKKSRFIAHVVEVHSEEEALSVLEDIKKKHWDARHNCSAYVIGENNELQRFSDDKEPQGTAGKPILEVLLANNVRNTIIVVTLYFGGILLGTGGLVRAYSTAASEGLKAACVCPVIKAYNAKISCDYNSSGKVKYIIEQLAKETGNVCINDTEYGVSVVFDIICELSLFDTLSKKITEATNAKAAIDVAGEISVAASDDGFVEYDF